MYYVLSGPDVSLGETVPGAAFAASVWTISLVGFRLYLRTSETVELYGLAGAVLLVLTWLYVGSFALLVGVVLNAVVAGRVEAEHEWLPTD